LFRLFPSLTVALILTSLLSTVQIGNVNGASGLGTIHGWVYGINYDDIPVALADANVTAKAQVLVSIFSRMNGEYQLYLPPGDYSIIISSRGYVTYTTHLAVSNGLTTEVNFYLKLNHNP